MPVHVVIKNRIKYYQWGWHGKLYREKKKAEAQGRAAYSAGYKLKKVKL
jgi:hypothetical protein